jgi:hypothetical protein
MFAERTWVGKVSGFFKENTFIDLDYDILNIDNYVLLPFATSISEDDIKDIDDEIFGNDNDFLKHYYLFKNSGLFYAENPSDYEIYYDSLEEIFNKYHLLFEFVGGS